jgi:uncharacterized protein (DUF1015 family)
MLNKGSMPDALIKPFKGLLYNKTKIGDISACVCPPYDIIPDPLPYYHRSGCNAVRLELPVATEDSDMYEAAKKTLDAWLRDAVLSFDDRESVYLYEQEFTLHGRTRKRSGLIPLVRLDRQRILTHEETRREAREDREKLIEKLRTFTSLILAMYEDNSGEMGRLIQDSPKEQIYDFIDELSIRNTFYRWTDPALTATLAAMMEEKILYVADGHHRLSVALKLGLPYVAMYLTDMHADGIAILPYHRVVSLKEKKEDKQVLALVAPYFDVAKVECPPQAGPEGLVEQISSSPTLSFALYFNGEKPSFYMLTQKKEIDFDPDNHRSLRRLKVNAVHRGVLTHLLKVQDDEISFLNSADDAVRLVNGKEYDFAVFVPATSVEEVKDIAGNGLCMPPKSTYFYPKALTGLVFHKYA